MSALSYHTKQCQALAKWAGMQRNSIPALYALVYIPNDGKRTPAAGGILKSMGMRAGVFDYLLAAPSRSACYPLRHVNGSGPAHGLWIEMKSEDDDLSEEQRLWNRIANDNGYATVMVRTWIAARDNILDYLGEKYTPSTKEGQAWRC